MKPAGNVVKLVSSQERIVHGCDTCKHRYKKYESYRCGAVELSCSTAKAYSCRDGQFWEFKGIPLPLAARIRKWWLGW